MEEKTSLGLLKNARLGLYQDKPSLETPSVSDERCKFTDIFIDSKENKRFFTRIV
jgi:hypothetical protein